MSLAVCRRGFLREIACASMGTALAGCAANAVKSRFDDVGVAAMFFNVKFCVILRQV